MNRLLLSFPLAALISVSVVVIYLADSITADLLLPIFGLSLVALVLGLALGLPFLPIVLNRSLTKHWQVIGLAGVAASGRFG